MEIIFEFLFQFIFEFLLQIVFEGLVELGLHGIANVFKSEKERGPVLSFIGYLILGLIAGALSLWIFPNSFVRSSRFHGISLIVTPIMAGLAMSGIGILRERKGKATIRLDSFSYGAVFAFGMALVRFGWTK